MLKGVDKLCNRSCGINSYGNCPRQKLQKKDFESNLTRWGTQETCPVLKMDWVSKPDNRKPFQIPYSEKITVDELWEVCDHCENSFIDPNGYIELKQSAYMDVCIDCPVNRVREQIEEMEAEAACS